MKTYFYLCYVILFAFSLSASEQKKTICLNMIVKNESKVINRCLDSVKPLIDYWVIVDTGSTDDTQSLIKKAMEGIPGELHERPWVNFEHNRNQALELAKGKADYVLIIDADELLKQDESFKLPLLDKDFYYILSDYAGTNYYRVQLIKNNLDWKWMGVVHEALNSTQARTNGTLANIRNVVHSDGVRSNDPKKFEKDVALLETALAKNPTNTRYTFYLAQSYRDAENYEKALENYQKRVAMGGWDEEVFYSMLQVAHLQEILDKPEEEFIDSYYKAFHYRPSRAEPLYYLANYYRQTNQYAQGYLLANLGLKIPKSKDILFVENWIYEYGLLLESSVCAYWIGKYEESQEKSRQILTLQSLDNEIREVVEKNLGFANKKIAEIYQRGILLEAGNL